MVLQEMQNSTANQDNKKENTTVNASEKQEYPSFTTFYREYFFYKNYKEYFEEHYKNYLEEKCKNADEVANELMGPEFLVLTNPDHPSFDEFYSAYYHHKKKHKDSDDAANKFDETKCWKDAQKEYIKYKERMSIKIDKEAVDKAIEIDKYEKERLYWDAYTSSLLNTARARIRNFLVALKVDYNLLKKNNDYIITPGVKMLFRTILDLDRVSYKQFCQNQFDRIPFTEAQTIYGELVYAIKSIPEDLQNDEDAQKREAQIKCTGDFLTNAYGYNINEPRPYCDILEEILNGIWFFSMKYKWAKDSNGHLRSTDDRNWECIVDRLYFGLVKSGILVRIKKERKFQIEDVICDTTETVWELISEYPLPKTIKEYKRYEKRRTRSPVAYNPNIERTVTDSMEFIHSDPSSILNL